MLSPTHSLPPLPDQVAPEHSCDVTPDTAADIQQQLRRSVRLEPLEEEPRYIAGADVSTDPSSNVIFGGFIVLSFPGLQPVDQAVVRTTTSFPYIPDLLSFREIPALLLAWEELLVKPDLVVVEAECIVHPRRLGIASHLGVLLDVPTIGCAKSLLTGTHEKLAGSFGASVPLLDGSTREPIGALLRSRRGANPLYVSPGHRIDANGALDMVRRCLRGYRLPEPTRRAQLLVNEQRRRR
jgi:deoxyribonuclease V